MNLTKKEAVRLHRLLWNKISELLEEGNTFPLASSAKEYAMNELRKDGTIKTDEIIQNNCFCYHYVQNTNGPVPRIGCEACPITWKKDRCCSLGGEFNRFSGCMFDGKFKEASKLAKKIANLPERPDQDFDIL